MCSESAISRIMAFIIFRAVCAASAGGNTISRSRYPIPIYSPSSFIEIRMALVRRPRCLPGSLPRSKPIVKGKHLVQLVIQETYLLYNTKL